MRQNNTRKWTNRSYMGVGVADCSLGGGGGGVMYKRELSERKKNFMRSEVESWCCSQKRALWAREDGADPCIGVEVTGVCSKLPLPD